MNTMLEPSEYELRKDMLSVMDDKEIASIIWHKRREALDMRVEESVTGELLEIADWLELPYEMAHNSYLEELRRECNEVISILEVEVRKRKNPDSQVDLAGLKASVPIDTVIKHYIPGVRHTRGNICCPFHNEKTPSLHVYRETNTFKCFGCGAGGTQLDWIMLSEKCDIRTAINRLKSFT